MDRRDMGLSSERERFIDLWIEEHGSKPATHYEVCQTCRGKGSHVNPNIDRQGLSSDDMDDEQWEAYWTDGYDEVCSECNGLRVVEEFSGEAEEAWDRWQQELLDDLAVRRAEAGGWWCE
jgi:hypothetical protein